MSDSTEIIAPGISSAHRAGLASIGKSISLAPDWEAKKVAWRNGLHEALTSWHGIERADVISECHAIAEAKDLIEHFGADAIQQALSDEVLRADAPKANGAAPPLQPADSDIETTAWWRDPADIPPREALYGKHFMRGSIGATIGAGGRAKTTLGTYESISMAVGFDLTTRELLPKGQLRVWFINAEEDKNELDRRFAATCLRHNISREDLGGRLFVESVSENPMRLATLVGGAPTLNQAAFDRMRDFITRNRVDVFMIDPFISFHAVNESTNADMDLLIKGGLGRIAKATNSHGEILHHPGKPKPGQDTTVEDGRGASAIIYAVRSARVNNFMTPAEATKLGISEDERRLYIRISNGKANMAPIGKAHWIKLGVENLPNGDEVACASLWTPPNPFDGVTSADVELARELARTGAHRADSRSSDWFGYPLAAHLKIDVKPGRDNAPEDLARLKAIIKIWLKNNVLAIEEREDEHRKKRQFIVPGGFQQQRPEGEDLDEDSAL